MTEPRTSLPEKQWARTYLREILMVMAAYITVLVVVVLTLPHVHGPGRYLLVTAPMVPFVGIPWAVARMLGRIDEMQRDRLLRTFTFAFFATAVVTFGYGFLELAGAPKISMFSVWPLMGGLWIIGGRVVGDGSSGRR